MVAAIVRIATRPMWPSGTTAATTGIAFALARARAPASFRPMSRSLQRKPWPMKWVVVTIVVFIAAYTFLTLRYRKSGHAYEPYADMKNRANTGRLLAAGYQRLELPIERPAEPLGRANNAFPAPGGWPTGLSTALVDAPNIPRDVLAVNAADSAATSEPYAIAFRCSGPDDHQQLGNVHVYVRGGQIIVAPNFEKLAGGLETRSREILATTELPAHTLKPGTYEVTMVGTNTSRAWRLVVR